MGFFCFLCSKIDLTGSCARRCRKSLSHHGSLFQCIRIESGMQQLIQRFCFNSADSFLGRDHTFIHKVACDLQSSLRRALAISGL